MSRIARVKPVESIFHVMCRSISELALFRDDDDKQYYLSLLKKYCDKFQCGVYAYCLMDNHLHLHFDPQGFDLSKFMHGVNLSYVRYYNIKYKRHGHLFQDRFESRVVLDDNYNLAVSAYIHNNAKDIEGYLGREHEYKFSSFGIYLGNIKDTLGLIKQDFILGLFDAKDKNKAIDRYTVFVKKQRDEATDKGIAKLLAVFKSNEYRSERRIIFRDFKPQDILKTVAEKLALPGKAILHLKFNPIVSDYRAYCTFLMKSLCGVSNKDICQSIGDISQAGVASLCKRGYELFLKNTQFREIFDELVRVVVA